MREVYGTGFVKDKFLTIKKDITKEKKKKKAKYATASS